MIASCTALTKSYPTPTGAQHEILHGIDLTVSTGEFVAIVGPSGSGKSTLLHCLSGLERPTTGTATIAGVDIGSASNAALTKLRRATVGFVFQAYNLVGSLSALENVGLQARLARRPKESALAALESVGVAHRAEAKPALLSGGEQQRVAIARALAAEPRVLFADEPTGALDSAAGRNVLHLLRRMVSTLGTTVILVTHDLEAAAQADRVLIMRDGLLSEELLHPTPAQLLSALEDAPAAAIGSDDDGGRGLDRAVGYQP